MYVAGYGLLTATIFGIVFFDSEAPIFVAVLGAALAGLGLGTIPTINTLVVQWTVPKRLLGASMGALFFSIAIGTAIAPAVLGSIMNTTHAKNSRRLSPLD
jgi:MFS family permease